MPATAYPWAEFAQESTQSCDGCFEDYWNIFHLNTIYLARNNTQHLHGRDEGQRVRPGGRAKPSIRTCSTCCRATGRAPARAARSVTVSLPTAFNLCSRAGCPRAIQVTSLAAGYIGQTPYLAVGLSDGGVQIYNVSNPSSPQLTGTFAGMATGDGSQTPATALAWDPSGSGLLAVGVISWANEGFVVRVNADGSSRAAG